MTHVALVCCLYVLSVGACSDVLGPPSSQPDAGELRPDSQSQEIQPEPTPKESPQPSQHIPYDQTWYGGKTLYQIFPRSFADTNADGIGDLRGIISKLDYLNTGNPNSQNDLKISGIWLTPIFATDSYHGYDVKDYRAIDPVYGTMDDFKDLLQEAHKRGIKVILDLVLNHTSRNHPWFKDASSGPQAAKRNWYVWKDQAPGWVHPFAQGQSLWHRSGNAFYYAIFSPAMPDLNYQHPPVVDAIKSIFKFWMDRGVDGFRLDAIRYLIAESGDKQADAVSTHKQLKALSRTLHEWNPQVLLAGEAWSTTAEVANYFGEGDELDLCFQFDLVDSFDRAIQRGRASSLITTLRQMVIAYKELQFNAPILGNHDHKRLMSRLNSQWSAAKLGATLLLSLPGTPFLYYGEEIGMGNSAAAGDIGKRAPMQWSTDAKAGFTKGVPWSPLHGRQEQVSVEAQGVKNDSLLHWYKQCIRLRQIHPALSSGTLRLVRPEGEPSSLLAYVREHKTQSLLVLLNVSEQKTGKISFQTKELAIERPTDNIKELLTQTKHVVEKDQSFSTLTLPSLAPHGAVIYQIK